MKNLFLHISIICLLAFPCSFSQAETALVSEEQLKPTRDHRRTTRIITRLLSNYHYKPAPLSDDLSLKILNSYIESLDPMRLYFTSEEIRLIYQKEYMFDNYIQSVNLSPFFAIFRSYRANLIRQTDYALTLVGSEFNFDINESIELDRKEQDWALDINALNELWRKRVKNEYLSIKLAGKKTAKEVKETLIRRYEGLQRRTKQLNSDDVYQIAINSYTSGIDPHTVYFTPRTTENFKISMSLSLEGIGAVLQNRDEHTVIRKIVPGGPADYSGKIFPDDRIISIGQNKEQILVDVVGWRLDDVVDLIRGPKGSVVTLEILPKNESLGGLTRVVDIIRDEIKLEEQAAKSFVLKTKYEGISYNVGIIEIPTFYLDFDGRKSGKKDYKSTTRDVRQLIDELENENIIGLVIDVRGNGGGSLSEATSLTGLFIDNGPVVQIRDYSGSVEIEKDPLKGTAYTGPLVVLVDKNSASASEIFAGAIQDYNRGLIVGESTYGKGTVQHLIDLNRYDRSSKGRLGQLKATMAQFFRVSGDSTQHRGVIPDIYFQGLPRPSDHGEQALENALPWAKIESAPHDKAGELGNLIIDLNKSHRLRLEKNEKISHLFEIEEEALAARKKTRLSLMESSRRSQFEKNKLKREESENKFRELYGLPPLIRDTSDDQTAEADEEQELYKDPKFDSILTEAVAIVADLRGLITKQ